MNLLHPPTLKALCARAGMRPSRAAGQNFLIHGGTLAAIVNAVAPQPGEMIVEVGAGFGVLTHALAERAARVIAIERDERIVPILREQVAEFTNVEVVEGDVLALLAHGGLQGFRALGQEGKTALGLQSFRAAEQDGCNGSGSSALKPLRPPFKIVANLPYSITSDFLRLLFDAVGTGALPPPERVVLLLQHEVVERLLGRTSADVGLLTMIARLHCARIHRIVKVPASHFWPAPKVASAIVMLKGWRTPKEITELLSGMDARSISPPPSGRGRSRGGGVHAEPLQYTNTRKQLVNVMRDAFSHPRRQLQNNLNLPPTTWVVAGVAPTARPATLTLDQWIALAREMV